MEYKNTAKRFYAVIAIMCLNPCSNGIQKYKTTMTRKPRYTSLNPCSNGIQKYSTQNF